MTDGLALWSESDMGWTPWLRSLQAKGQPEAKKGLLVTDIFDFDDHAFHIPQNLGRRIATALSEETFGPYMRGLLDLRKMEMAGVSLEVLDQQSERVNQTFVRNFNQVSSKSRVLLLLDTTDALARTDVWNYVSNLALQMENVLFLVAGRNTDVLWDDLKSEIGKDAQLVELPPLETEASEWYLQQKQELLHVTLDPKIAQKLLLLARGLPILIDLAVEWTAREIPLDWLVKKSLKQLKELSDEEIKKRRKEFEYQLVHHIADIRTQMDRLILVLSHVYPLNREMIVELLGLSEDEAGKLLEEARTYVFVKLLPDRRIALHDEMRRMVNDYVWPEADPDGDRKRRDSKLAAVYCQRKIRDLKGEIDQLKERDLEEIGVTQELADMERSYWLMQVYRVRYAVYANWTEGISIFATVFDEATRHYQPYIRRLLLNSVEENLEEAIEKKWHNRDARYKYEIRLVQDRLDTLDDLEGVHRILESLKADNPEQERQVDILTRLANCARLSGNLQKAIGYLEQALAICEARPEIMGTWGGTILNTMGWMHRLMGEMGRSCQALSAKH
jgi:hypothetical protein